MNHRNIQTAFFLVFFIGIGVLMFFLLKPFITPLIIAFTLAILFYPLFRKLTRMTHGRKRIAALLNILVIIVVVMGRSCFSASRSSMKVKIFTSNTWWAISPSSWCPNSWSHIWAVDTRRFRKTSAPISNRDSFGCLSTWV